MYRMKPDTNPGKKISFHVPGRDADIVTLIEMAAEVTNQTTSEWVYRVVRQKLQAAGILGPDDEIKVGAVQKLINALPPSSRLRDRWNRDHQ